MDLFTYLMGKNDKNLLPHSDLFSYLLGKNIAKLQTASGTEISLISKKGILDNIELSKLSTQEGTPTPENPVEVKTVKGYRNELSYVDNINQTVSVCKWESIGDGKYKIIGTPSSQVNFSGVAVPFTYTIEAGDYLHFGNDKTARISVGLLFSNNTSTSAGFTNVNFSYSLASHIGKTISKIFVTINSGNTTNEVIFNPMIIKKSTSIPFVPYGNNYILTTITDGTNTKNITIPLNDNEICGIGNYKDELIVDSNGKCWLNKKTGKVILNGTESWTTAENNTNTTRLYTDISDIFNAGVASDQNVYVMSNKLLGVKFGTVYNDKDTEYIVSNYNQQGSSEYKRIVVRIPKSIATTAAGFKTWLSSNYITVYYVLMEAQMIDLNQTVDMNIYKGTNTITNSEEADMTIQYY